MGKGLSLGIGSKEQEVGGGDTCVWDQSLSQDRAFPKLKMS